MHLQKIDTLPLSVSKCGAFQAVMRLISAPRTLPARVSLHSGLAHYAWMGDMEQVSPMKKL
jgi:hypothetical protein